MLNHQRRGEEVFGRQSWTIPAAVGAALGLVLVLGASSARAQECQSDADCGFGFRCNQQVISTTTNGSASVTGVSATAVGTTGYPPHLYCGDSVCSETEDPDVCPEDCGTISFCEGASCESDSECAEGYSCQPKYGIYSTTTTGSDGPLCGDRTCEEGEEACDTDCSTELTCQVTRCETDADCGEGLYCDPKGGSAVAGVSGSSGGASGGTIELYQSDCVPLPTDGAGGNSTVVGGVGTVGGSGLGGSHSHGNGNGNGNGSGHGPPWPYGPHRGCALAAAPVSGSPLLAALAGLFACGLVQRRRRNE